MYGIYFLVHVFDRVASANHRFSNGNKNSLEANDACSPSFL